MLWLYKVDYQHRESSQEGQRAERDSEHGEKFAARPIPGYEVRERLTIVLMDSGE